MNRRSFLKSLSFIGFSVWGGVLNAGFYVKEKLNLIDVIDISNESTEGGEIKCFSEAGVLSKVVIEQYGESGKYYLHLFLEKGNLLKRAEEIETHYNRPFYWDKMSAEEADDTEYFDIAKSKIIKREYWFQNNLVEHSFSNYESELTDEFLERKVSYFKKRVDFIKRRLSTSTTMT